MSYHREAVIATDVSIDKDSLMNRVVYEKLQRPTAYIEIIDTDDSVISVSTCTSFRVGYGMGDGYGIFNCTIDKASSWNVEGATKRQETQSHLNKRVKIYYGQYVNGSFIYELIFTGIQTKRPERYSFGAENLFKLNGTGVGYLMEDYSVSIEGYTGSDKYLAELLIGRAGLIPFVGYYSRIYYVDEDISYSNVLSYLDYLKSSYGPKLEYWCNHDGVIYVVDRFANKNNLNEFSNSSLMRESLGGSNFYKFYREEDLRKIITSLNLTSAQDDGTEISGSYTTDSDLYSRCGDNFDSYDIPFELSSVNLSSYADDIFFYGEKYLYYCSGKTTLNPYIKVGQIIDFTESSLMYLTNEKFYVERVVHYYNPPSSNFTEVIGHFLYE